MKNSVLFMTLLLAGSIAGNAKAENIYNGPLSPKPSGYSVYSYYGTFNDVLNAMNSTASLAGVPEGYKILPWFLDSDAAKSYAINWYNGLVGGAGDKFPNPPSGPISYTPWFAWYTDYSGSVISAYNTNTGTTGDSYNTALAEQTFYAVAVSQ